MSALQSLKEVSVFWDSWGLTTILSAKFDRDVDEKAAIELTHGMLASNYGYGFIEWANVGSELIAADAFTHVGVELGTRR